MADLAKLVEEIKGMTVLELSTLVKTLETEFGVSAAAPTAVVAAAGAAAGGEAAKAEEKTEFTVVMTDCGAQKLAVIKVVRSLFPELSLPDAKKAVETVPFTVKENIEKEEADKLAAALKEAGATVELK